MTKFRKIGVLTSGGDAPGMNAALRAVTRSAIERGVGVMGIYRGYRGLIENDIRPLGYRDMSGILHEGGTILYSDRCQEFRALEGQKRAAEICRANDIDGVVVIGGDGTFRGGVDLTAQGIPTIGIPATIDNDIASTDFTIGFDTAVNTSIEMVDRLRDTCESLARSNVVEVMGRDAGDIALHVGIAVGAIGIAIKEIPFDEEALLKKIINAKNSGKRNYIIIVSEGLGNYSEHLAEIIPEKTGVDTRFARLAHVVRGGRPTARDRMLATRMGDKAVECLLNGESNVVMCERNGEIIPMDITYALKLDRMYKKKLKEGELNGYSLRDIEEMRAICAEKTARLRELYDMAERMSK